MRPGKSKLQVSILRRQTKQLPNEKGTDDPGPVRRRVRDFTPLQNAELTSDPFRSSRYIPSLRRDDVKSSNSLSVQSCVLGVTLANKKGNILLDEMSNSPSVVL